MVLAYHVVFSCYGFWLPNDPRRANSDYVREPKLLPYGHATKTNHRRSVAQDPHDREVRELAKHVLEYEPVVLSGIQALAVGQGFAEAVKTSGFVLHACSIMPDHVHLIVKRHSYMIERVVAQLKGAASRRVRLLRLHPFAQFERPDGTVPSLWAEGLRKVFLSTARDIRGRVKYVEDNPTERGLPPQRWSFVTPYDK